MASCCYQHLERSRLLVNTNNPTFNHPPTTPVVMAKQYTLSVTQSSVISLEQSGAWMGVLRAIMLKGRASRQGAQLLNLQPIRIGIGKPSKAALCHRTTCGCRDPCICHVRQAAMVESVPTPYVLGDLSWLKQWLSLESRVIHRLSVKGHLVFS